MPRITTLAIDGDDTLWHCRHNHFLADWHCGQLITEAIGATVLSPSEILIFQKEIEITAMEQHGYRLTQFEDAWVEAYRQLATKAGCLFESSVATAIFNAANHIRRAPYPVLPEARTVLEDVARLVSSIHLVSLGDEECQMKKFRDSGLADLFTKTHITVGSKALILQELAQAEPGVIMVGDSLRTDIDPAVSLGLPAVWIRNSYIWTQSKNELDPRVHVIDHLAELPALLRSLI